MSSVKLHINLVQGILDVEGDIEFVREVYRDYRDGLIAKSTDADAGSVTSNGIDVGGAATANNGSKENDGGRRRRKPSANKALKESGSGISSYKPALVGDLDTKDIKTFLRDYEPKNHYDNIVLFTLYLERKGISPAAFNQIYTCYRDAQIKTPVAFAQAFIDARGNKRGFIEFTDPTNVTLTERGRNHGQFGGIKKKAVEPA
ncbi:hypothetical protein [Agrobacterium pusense]|uniref:hypothetical protein n=1 Tax=Agrobacterium pusense TaxID=648995 RepID=UPI000D3D28E1|nr:hypothetical protein [Agrobacterium pusense]PTV74731.1 hypothetical protein DBL06_14775 [Agrobacterium pusense]